MKKITLKLGKAKPFLNDELLIFSGAIHKVSQEPQAAELVEVYSSDQQFIGIGVYNPHSSYRIRLLSRAREKLAPDLAEIIHYRLQEAIKYRHSLNLPNSETNAYRLLNSEGDGLSGLTIDVFANYCIVSITAYWVMYYRDIVASCLEKSNFVDIIWRPQEKSLLQDGWHNPLPEPEEKEKIILIKENSIQYQIDIAGGQKTGFYCDQRDNRLLIRSLAKNKKVLDCFCYNGGFALNSAHAGAKKTIGIDSSASAIQQANSNIGLNKLTRISFETAKVEDFLSTRQEANLIILDPPKLAPTKASLGRAKQRYLKLNTLAMSSLEKDGLLFTCSCSNAIDKQNFISLLQLAAKKLNRKIEVISTHGAAPDHRLLSRANYGNYLKAVLLRMKN